MRYIGSELMQTITLVHDHGQLSGW